MTPPIPLELAEPKDFDYSTLDSKTRKLVEQRTSEIKSLVRQTAQGIINIGRKLIEVKEKMGPGNFGKWVEAEFGWGNTTAWKLMRVASTFKFSQCENLNIATSALYLLAEPSTPEEVRQEALERARQGEVISYKTAKNIVSHHTIDVKAEVVKDEESPVPTEISPEPSLQHQPLDKFPAKPKPDETASLIRLDPDQTREWLSEQEVTSPSDFAIGDRVRILRRQHGGDNWIGKTAHIWQITPNGWLRVAVEGHQGVKFTLKPEWVEPVTETPPEKYKVQPEPVPFDWADESDPESPEIANVPSEEQKKAVPRFQVGDWLQGTNLGQHSQEWAGEVAEVLEVTETAIKVIVQIPRSSQ